MTAPSSTHTLQDWHLRAVFLSVFLAAAGYLLVSLWGGWREVVAALLQVSLFDLAVLLALSLLNYGLRFVRWQYYLGLLGHRIQAGPSLRIYLAGFALTTTPGKAGEALRSVLLQRYRVAYPVSLAALLSERLGDLLAMIALTAIGVYAYPQARGIVLALALLLVAVLFIIQRRAWLQALDERLRRKLRGKLARLAAGLIETVLHSSRLFTLPLLLYSLGLGLLAWGAEGLALYYLVHLLGLELDLGTALFIYAFSMLVGAVSFLPGGLGSAEVTMVALLVLNGMPEGAAVAATVLIRLTTLWFAVVLGMGALVAGRK